MPLLLSSPQIQDHIRQQGVREENLTLLRTENVDYPARTIYEMTTPLTHQLTVVADDSPPTLGSEQDSDDVWRRSQASRRRKSRVTKQHSYDEETKPTAAAPPELGLGEHPITLFIYQVESYQQALSYL